MSKWRGGGLAELYVAVTTLHPAVYTQYATARARFSATGKVFESPALVGGGSNDKRHETRAERERNNSANFHRNETLNALPALKWPTTN